MNGPRVEICGAVFPAPDVDCICLQDPHDDDTPHLCDAPGCGRAWTSQPVRGTA